MSIWPDSFAALVLEQAEGRRRENQIQFINGNLEHVGLSSCLFLIVFHIYLPFGDCCLTIKYSMQLYTRQSGLGHSLHILYLNVHIAGIKLSCPSSEMKVYKDHMLSVFFQFIFAGNLFVFSNRKQLQLSPVIEIPPLISILKRKTQTVRGSAGRLHVIKSLSLM